MTSLSFIITTYNIEAYIERCLFSVAAVVQPGDQVIIVDDGSTDDTPQVVARCMTQAQFGTDVELDCVMLGANTQGGVGIPANIALRRARKDAVFFVDGDDWIDQQGFRAARSEYAAHPTDIMTCQYREYDQLRACAKDPADQARWSDLNISLPHSNLVEQTLGFIAVPWRKFYDRAFLVENDLTFPEGDFFFEDNPFHWAVCRAARSIRFCDAVVCHHRINRPGQTMASTGRELIAFFTHYQTIAADLPKDDIRLQAAAARWIVNQMSWHITRLKKPAELAYFTQAARTLATIPALVWDGPIERDMGHTHIWGVAQQLRGGDIWGLIARLEIAGLAKRLANVERSCAGLARMAQQSNDAVSRVKSIDAQVKSLRTAMTASQSIEQFRAIKRSIEIDVLDGPSDWGAPQVSRP